MSKYAPNIDRGGVAWDEAGKWKQGQDIVHLQTLAEKMVIPPDANGTDILNSIPTPWSRLLLFESALFNEQHPAHAEILSQWRGLLGLLALADPLGIEVFPADDDQTIKLSDFVPQSSIAKTFLDLAPSYLIENQDAEAGKWHDFHFISVEDHIIGATSPRTLVFTGVSPVSSHSPHNTLLKFPESIPFFKDGRIYDPLKYYRKFKDQQYLMLLKVWLTGFINWFSDDAEMIGWLGVFPSPPGTVAVRRHEKLLALFNAWLNEVDVSVTGEITPPVVGQLREHFTLPGYHGLKFLPEIPYDPASDLLLDTRKIGGERSVIVCYRPDYSNKPKKNSMLFNDRNMRIQSDNIKISQGRWVKADASLPEKMSFLPEGWDLIADPIEEFFEDKLIEISLPAGDDAHAVYSLNVNAKNFLFPFKKKILDYFEPEEIHRYTSISIEPNQGHIVTLEIPLRGGSRRKILATRFYEESRDELAVLNRQNDHRTAELAMFPKFQSPNWKYHYYFKRSLAKFEVDFTPVSEIEPRRSPDETASWYFSSEPVAAFVGTLNDSKGLLLPRYEKLEPSASVDFWNVSVDFGSTHTRAFYLEMQSHDGGYIRIDNNVEQIKFTTYAKFLTLGDGEQLKNDFFALEGKITPAERTELKTLLMRPVNDRNNQNIWLPRDGFGYMHWIHSGFDSRRIKADIKWEGTGSNDDLRSYLRWLMVQIMAEAVQKNARIVKVLRSYPSSFNETLKAHHNAEWVALANFIGNDIQIRAFEENDEELLSEAIATARYLTAIERAPSIVNTISFDIGGSTTDIAVWSGKPNQNGVKMPTLGAQESVRMAAGLVGKYLQTDRQAKDFLDWFVEEVNKQNQLGNISLDSFQGAKNGYALMFYNILSYYEQGGELMKENLNALIGLLKTEPKAVGLMAHINFLFGGLIYYSGQLARKAGLQDSGNQTYHLYFCGKGGTLIKWIDRYKTFVEKLFIAGLFGPDSDISEEERNRIIVNVKVSAKPKEEVGRGLLVRFAYQEESDGQETFGLYDLRAPSVTVGETGYSIRPNATEHSQTEENQKLDWDARLDEKTMRRLDSQVPSLEEMKELNHFIKAIGQAFKVQDEGAPVFDFEGILNSNEMKRNFVDAVTARLFNTDESGILFRLQNDNDTGALVEPLIITEMKVLLEFLSNNDLLFK